MGILEWMVANKAVVIGAAGVISELIVIAVNTYRAIRANKKQIEAMGLPSKPTEFDKKVSVLLWAANPINLFRKP